MPPVLPFAPPKIVRGNKSKATNIKPKVRKAVYSTCCLLVSAPCMHTATRWTLSRPSHMPEGSREKWFFWCFLLSEGLCGSHLALQCCCSLIRSSQQAAGAQGQHWGLCSAAPGCPPTGLLSCSPPPNGRTQIYVFSHTSKGEGERNANN